MKNLDEEFRFIYMKRNGTVLQRTATLPDGRRVRWCEMCEVAKPIKDFIPLGKKTPRKHCLECGKSSNRYEFDPKETKLKTVVNDQVVCSCCHRTLPVEDFYMRSYKNGARLPVNPCISCRRIKYLERKRKKGELRLKHKDMINRTKQEREEIPDINKRILKVVENEARGKISLCSRMIGVSQGAMGRLFGVQYWGKCQEPSGRMLYLLLEKFPHVSAEWLMRGEGNYNV